MSNAQKYQQNSQPPALGANWQPAWVDFTLYFGMYAACGMVFFVGVGWWEVTLCVASYVARLLGMTVGYHRYFAHRSFKTSRGFQFFLALLGSLAIQKGVLWWADSHRYHHRYADTARDPHSPRYKSFIYCYFLWTLDKKYHSVNKSRVPDLAGYRELVWLTTWPEVPVLVYAASLYAAFGLSGFIWGFVVSTVLLWQPTHCVVALSHGKLGYRRFATPDDTNNNWFVSLISLGEGWHNNHHHLPYSARQGFGWSEPDLSWLVISALERVGLVWDVRLPPASVLASGKHPHVLKFGRWVTILRSDVRDTLSSFAQNLREQTPDRKQLLEMVTAKIEASLDEFVIEVQDALIRQPGELANSRARLEDVIMKEIEYRSPLMDPAEVDDLQQKICQCLCHHFSSSHIRHLFGDLLYSRTAPQV